MATPVGVHRSTGGTLVIDTAAQVWTALRRATTGPPAHFDPATVAGLPEPARRFLVAALPPSTPLATGVELGMEGRIKLGIWLPFTARQILRAGTGLVWDADVGGRLLRFVGADTLGPDGASMKFRFHDRITIVDADGPDVDRSAAGRLAAETVAWLPQALTPQAGATWKPLDEHRATVVVPGPSGPVDVNVTIDEHGRMIDIELERWNGSLKPPRLQSFGSETTSTLVIDGVPIAGEGTVGWGRETPSRDDGVFFRYRIESARFLLDEVAERR